MKAYQIRYLWLCNWSVAHVLIVLISQKVKKQQHRIEAVAIKHGNYGSKGVAITRADIKCSSFFFKYDDPLYVLQKDVIWILKWRIHSIDFLSSESWKMRDQFKNVDANSSIAIGHWVS